MCPRRSSRAEKVSRWGRATPVTRSSRCIQRRATGVARPQRMTPPALRATSPREAWGGAHELLVRIDQKLLAGRALVVGGDVLEIEHPGQRDHLRVMAGERPLQGPYPALAQPHLPRPAHPPPGR